MMTISDYLIKVIQSTFKDSMKMDVTPELLTLQRTKPDFEGEYTLVTFGLAKTMKLSPEEAAHTIGKELIANHPDIFSSYNVIKGFLNLCITPYVYTQWLISDHHQDYQMSSNGQTVMVEYSSPNTNKPLHFGHLRNIFLGYSISEIYEANGYQVIKANLINDRGIHICKSMLAWQRWGHGETPESSGMKGDHLVGKYYVMFETKLKEETYDLFLMLKDSDTSHLDVDKPVTINEQMAKYKTMPDGKEKNELEKFLLSEIKNSTSLMQDARAMLKKWEDGDPQTIELWKTMNAWVYKGFEVSYHRMGVDFDQYYYESNTYLLGKDLVLEGLQEGKVKQEQDNSIWVDLTDQGLDMKLLLRSDGTAVYITQDLGTAKLKFDNYPLDESIYVIGDEQNYHMQVLTLTLEKLGQAYAKKIYHLSYGMVELPDGKMKSREGKVVDADDMMNDMVALAKQKTEEAEKSKSLDREEASKLYEMIGLGALKFFLLRVNPKKKMIFNPQESIDLHGFTATAIQYTHARICSIFRHLGIEQKTFNIPTSLSITDNLEKELILKLSDYNLILRQAKAEYDPSHLAIYLYELSRQYNSFYDKCSILKAENDEIKNLRLSLCKLTADTIREGMKLLGIEVPDKM